MAIVRYRHSGVRLIVIYLQRDRATSSQIIEGARQEPILAGEGNRVDASHYL